VRTSTTRASRTLARVNQVIDMNRMSFSVVLLAMATFVAYGRHRLLPIGARRVA